MGKEQNFDRINRILQDGQDGSRENENTTCKGAFKPFRHTGESRYPVFSGFAVIQPNCPIRKILGSLIMEAQAEATDKKLLGPQCLRYTYMPTIFKFVYF